MKSPPPRRLLMTLPDYQRAFQVINSLVQNEKANTAKACLYFGFIGAAILRVHYKINARAAVGFALYKLDESNDLLALAGSTTDGRISASLDGFHCWVQANEWVIDFSAPLFPEMWAQAGQVKHIPRNMLQKRSDALATQVESLRHVGDALLHEEPTLTANFQRHQDQHPMNKDLENIALRWFVPTPKKIMRQISIGNQKGQLTPVQLSNIAVSGAW